MEKTNLNYAHELIPDAHTLVDRCLAILESISALKHYGFKELFPEKVVVGNIEYHRNQSIWNDIYNTWDKRAYDEIQKPKSMQRKKNEVKGVYIFYENDQPIYAGISRAIIRRLKNHFLGRTHNEASLVYLIAREEYEKDAELYMKTRAEFTLFQNRRPEIQQLMRQNWKISILPLADNYDLYLTELLIACKLKTYWNSFETH